MKHFLRVVLALGLAACDGGDGDEDAGAIDTDAGNEMDGGMDGGRIELMDAGMDDGGMDAGTSDTDGGTDAGMDAGMTASMASAQIAAVLAAAAGPSDLPIEGALVTYVRPAIGTDVAGFFLQADREGPAIFVAVDPASLTPAAMVGQRVDLRATDLSDTMTNQGRREVLAITGWTVTSEGNDVSALVQDATSIDLVTMLDAYRYELITTDFEIRGLFRTAGPGYSQITVDTPGVTGSDAISLRVPDTLVAALDLEPGCTYTLDGTPLWSFQAAAQLTAFDASEVTLARCDPPRPTHADALNERTVVVRFDRVLDAASVMASGAQFTIESSTLADIPVTAASAGPMYVVLTTSADLTAGTFYTVRVASSVLDSAGNAVPAGSMVMFEGYAPHLVINEIDYDQVGSDNAEFVELHNPGLTAIPLSGVTFYVIDVVADVASVRGMVDLVPNSASVTSLAPGGYLLVLSSNSSALTGIPAGVPTVMASVAFQNGTEGVAVSATGVCHDIVYYGGIPMSPATIAECALEGSAGTDTPEAALSRIPNGSDFDETALDYVIRAPTPGAANSP